MLDLFGNDYPEKGASVAPVSLSLIDYAAEKAAMVTGRAKSQEKAEIVAPIGGRCLIHGSALLLLHGGGFSCPRCG